MGMRHPVPKARDVTFNTRGCLLPLEFGNAHQFHHAADRGLVETLRNDLLGRFRLLHVQFQNLVQQFVGRQAVLIGLVRAAIRPKAPW